MPAPDKVQRFLDRAKQLGLSVREMPDERHTDIRAWIVWDEKTDYGHQIWLYYTPGPRGGSRTFRLYSRITNKVKRITGRAASSWLHTLAI